ncbi:endonuclease/exonuclease/phosphatase family protein [Pyxidicoccus parkwayensis]|jgi:uncharacterized protein|uniref:Endonuclease/exonuclease/phosphatase family protein n=1 Tax=Pyxidicoccus parkwayensis TaxID=2813578 RepID=A0ABX7P3U9_9BACT|nr:endonuclease/exonuclease/phosphatase family protein [Pyxidicoccus parkwaysis]QSQ25159.1 endonuclease/exonuclease/phosphatase family protein [Pyxidicoccus parkwaysis]
MSLLLAGRPRAFRSTLRRAAAWMGLALALPGCQDRDSPGTEQACTTGDCGAPAGDEEHLRIAAFNVHRLFDTVCDSGACGAGDYEALPTPDAFATQADRLAQGISRLGADVVLLGEIETQASLDALQSRLPVYRHAVLGETGAPASVDVAVLSTWPVLLTRGHREQELPLPGGGTTRFARELLEVHLDTPGARTIVFAAHFRSKVSDDPARRLAEAVGAHDIIAATARDFPDALVVLGGDLNDVPGSPPLNALEQDGALLRVSSDRPDSETWTYAYSGDQQAIDHLYLARGVDGRGGEYVPGSFRAVREGRSGYGGSDHAAVYADFVTAP